MEKYAFENPHSNLILKTNLVGPSLGDKGKDGGTQWVIWWAKPLSTQL